MSPNGHHDNVWRLQREAKRARHKKRGNQTTIPRGRKEEEREKIMAGLSAYLALWDVANTLGEQIPRMVIPAI
jgi:hypothetical protein